MSSEISKRYSQRGVSASKEDVHNAIKNVDKGLFPRAFCKIVPDYLTNDEDYCLIMHADGAGTKSSLAYMYWKETGDVSEYESPDHRQLDTHIFMYNLVSDAVTDLSEDKNSGTIDLDPRFSPNESEIIFVNTSNDGISQRNIFRLGINAGGSNDLLFCNAFMPDWE